MTCSAYWGRQVQDRILSRWPDVKVVQARAYNVPKVFDDGRSVPGVIPADGDPIKQMVALLRASGGPRGTILMFHPRGGVSVNSSASPK